MYLKFLRLFLFFLVFSYSLSAQITGKITLAADHSTYIVSIIPSETIQKPDNITNTAQITLKAKTKHFEIENFKSLAGNWRLNTIITSPVEAPDYDYFIFNLATHFLNPPYQRGEELALFSFQNEKECTSSIALIENHKDAFFPPNSQSINIGNHFTIFKFGPQNAYEENAASHSVAPCTQALKTILQIDSMKCAGEKAVLNLTFEAGTAPFYYQIQFENGQLLEDSLIQVETSTKIHLEAGQHQFMGHSAQDTIQQSLEVIAPNALGIELIAKKNMSCYDSVGTIFVAASGGSPTDTYQFNWSNGDKGPRIAVTETGTYSVSLTNQNNCLVSKDIFITKEDGPTIDSIFLIEPSCEGRADGEIEIVEVSNGTPPYEYAIDKNSFQPVHFFDNISAGDYQLFVTDAKNCVTSLPIYLPEKSPLKVSNLPKDTVLPSGAILKFEPSFNSQDALNFNWQPKMFLSCYNCATPIARPTETITYTLEVSDDKDCVSFFESTINVIVKRPIYVPNVFSPNNDGQNDQLEVFAGYGVQKIQRLQVFNRWGQLVFDKHQRNDTKLITWDGKLENKVVNAGVYLYIVEVIMENGNTEIHKGDFFVLK